MAREKGSLALYCGSGGTSGSLAGSLVALMILGFFWFKTNRDNQTDRQNENVITTKELTKKLLLYSVTICVSSLPLLFIQLVDALNLYALLSGGEASEEAKRLKGIYDRGQPFFAARFNFRGKHCDVTRSVYFYGCKKQ
nr:oligosaccharide flippase family protein [Bacillus subtilis]